jgi:hypothetical protein
MIDNALFHERCRGTCLHAGTAGHAFGIEEVFSHARGHFRLEAPTFDRQGKRTLNFIASAHTARANNAFAGIELEIRVAGVDARVEMILAIKAVAHITQADGARHILQFAVAVR